jgi:hypothetical protein
MKKYFVAVAAAGCLMMGGAAQADSVVVDGALCGFNANQMASGFTCIQSTSTVQVSRIHGGGQRCQDASVTVTILTSINKNNQVMEDRTLITDPVQDDWSSSYPIGEGCNNPV